MTGQTTGHHEARINDALKQLGEEFRLGMVKAEEYRARRRAIVESWGEVDATTSPGSLRRTVPGAGSARPAGVAAAAPAVAKKPGVLVIAAIAIAVLGAGAYFVLKSAARPPAMAPVPGAAPKALSPGVVAIGKAADAFVAANSFERQAIDAFVAQWQALSDADRAQALQEPPLRTLRYKLDQNIQAESQLVAPDAPPEARARLTLLEDFARSLGGGGQ